MQSTLRSLVFLFVAVSAIAVMSATAGPPVRAAALGDMGAGGDEIPLHEIWALDMPGTRPMNRTLVGDPPVYEAPEGRLVDEIRSALEVDPGQDASPGECFAVPGSGLPALREAHAVLVEGRERHRSFPPGEPISVVFFALEYGAYIQLADVRQQGTQVRVHYRIATHDTNEVTAHLALIPLTTPLSGLLEVQIEGETESSPSTYPASRVVCKSYTLTVEE